MIVIRNALECIIPESKKFRWKNRNFSEKMYNYIIKRIATLKSCEKIIIVAFIIRQNCV